jgi:hypothetical protein
MFLRCLWHKLTFFDIYGRIKRQNVEGSTIDVIVDIDDVSAKLWIHFCREKVEVLGEVGEVAHHPCTISCQRYVEVGTEITFGQYKQRDKPDQQTNKQTDQQTK